MSADLPSDRLRLAREAADAADALERMSDLAEILGEAPDPLHTPGTEPRRRLAEAAAVLRGWAQRIRLDVGAAVTDRADDRTVPVDREALVEAMQLVDRADGYVQTSEGEPALPDDFAAGIAALAELRRLLHGLVAATDRPSDS